MTSAASRIDYGTARNGARQLRRQWAPVGPQRASMLIVHGISAHSGRYEHFGSTMAAAGFGVVTFDQRGHGQTEGRHTYIDNFSEFLDDVEDQLAQLRAIGLPVVLFGHSMGGLVCTSYAVSDRPQPDLLALSGPALGMGVPDAVGTFVTKLAQLAPRLLLKPPSKLFNSSMLSRDPAVGQAYEADPLVRPGSTVQLLSQMVLTQREVAQRLDRLRVPTLCLHGGDDEIVPAHASEILDGLPLVTRRVVDGLRHEIFNEPERDELLAELTDWINQRL